MAPGETENNAYAKFWCEKRRVLWYGISWSGQLGIAMIGGGEIRGGAFKGGTGGLRFAAKSFQTQTNSATVFKTRKIFLTLIRFVLHTESSNSSN